MCNHEAPSVEEAATKYAGRVNVIGIAWQGSDDEMQGFIDKHGLTFPQVNDDPANVFDRFDVPGQPAWVFIGTDGEIQQLLGAAPEATLDQILTDLSS